MIGKFISMLFLARDLAHREHLRVRGVGAYAAHMALGSFYEDVIGLADRLTEAYQGRTGKMVDIELLDDGTKGDIITTLQSQLKWLEDNRYKAVPKDDSPLQNIVDEIVSTYLSTIYKLKNLK